MYYHYVHAQYMYIHVYIHVHVYTCMSIKSHHTVSYLSTQFHYHTTVVLTIIGVLVT